MRKSGRGCPWRRGQLPSGTPPKPPSKINPTFPAKTNAAPRQIADTVVVKPSGPPEVMTPGAPKEFDKISYTLKGDDEVRARGVCVCVCLCVCV